jgi:hypothetical protein
MKTKHLSIAFISLLMLTLVGCSKDGIINKELDEQNTELTLENYLFKGLSPAAKVNNHAITKVIKFFEAEGPFEFDYTVLGCSPAPFLTVCGTGTATHLGLYNIINLGCYDGYSLIVGTITTANGDEIHTYIESAYQDVTTGVWYYHYVIYNGTGKFEGATGDINMYGTLDFENFVWNLQGEGTITY